MCGNPIDGMGLKARIGKRPRTACSAKRADSSGAVSAPPSREAPKPRISANTAAPRARADSKDSSTKAAPPSPGTKPSRASSKGRDASDGTGFRLSAWALAYPSIPPRERRESPDEQSTVSERPYRTRRKPSPIACNADAHAVPITRPSPWISRKRANAVFPVLGSQRKSHNASSASESAGGSPFSRSKSSMGPDAPIRQVCGGMCGSNPAEAAARRPDKTASAAPRVQIAAVPPCRKTGIRRIIPQIGNGAGGIPRQGFAWGERRASAGKRPRDAALLPSEAGTAAYAGDDDPIHIPAKAAPRGRTPQCHQGRAAGRHPGWTSQGRAPSRVPGKGRDIHGG